MNCWTRGYGTSEGSDKRRSSVAFSEMNCGPNSSHVNSRFGLVEYDCRYRNGEKERLACPELGDEPSPRAEALHANREP